MQLLIEHATNLAGFDQILFVDTDMTCGEPFEFLAMHAGKNSSYSSHTLTPGALLLIHLQVYQHAAPSAFLLRIVAIILNWGSIKCTSKCNFRNSDQANTKMAFTTHMKNPIPRHFNRRISGMCGKICRSE